MWSVCTYHNEWLDGITPNFSGDNLTGLRCLTPLSTIFQLYRGDQFYCGGNRNTRRKPLTYIPQVDDKLRFIIDTQVDITEVSLELDLKGYLQQRVITCHLYRKSYLVKLCELAQELQLETVISTNDYEQSHVTLFFFSTCGFFSVQEM